MSVTSIRIERSLALGQGAYYTATGLWPLLSIRSFEAVTGPKRDDWLVQTVGSLITAVGATLLFGGARRRATRETALLAIATASAFIGVDVVFWRKRKIANVYLLDAAVELAMVAGWLVTGAWRLSTESARTR